MTVVVVDWGIVGSLVVVVVVVDIVIVVVVVVGSLVGHAGGTVGFVLYPGLDTPRYTLMEHWLTETLNKG